MNSRAAVRLFRAFERKEEKGDQKMKRRIREAVTALVLAAVILLPIQGRSVSAESAGQGDASEKLSFTVDFGEKGYWYSEELGKRECYAQDWEAFLGEKVQSDDDDIWDIKADLDGDGTQDIGISLRYYVRMDYRCNWVIVPLPGNSLKEQIVIEGNEASRLFGTITFIPPKTKVKEEYTVKVKGGKAKGAWSSEDFASVIKAKPGEAVLVSADPVSGKYVRRIDCNDVDFPYDADQEFALSFVMPAHDVTLTIVMAPQETGIIEVDPKDDDWLSNDLWGAFTTIKGEEIRYDFDGDGTYDVWVSNLGTQFRLVSYPYRSIGESYTISGENPGQRYNRVTIHFPDGRKPYEVDISKPVENYYNIEEKISFSSFLEPFESAEKPGFYDLNGDEKFDIWLEPGGNYFYPLATYSCGESYTIPANKLNNWKHPIKFVLKDEMKPVKVSLETGEGGTAEMYYTRAYFDRPEASAYVMVQSVDDSALTLSIKGKDVKFAKDDDILLFPEMVIYLMITPDEGYEIDQVTSNGLWEEKGYLYVLKDTDAALKVMFKKIEEPEPTVTPTATPTPTVTPTQDADVTPTAAPKEDETDAGKKGEDGFNPFYIIIPVLLLIGGLTAVVLIRNKKKK